MPKSVITALLLELFLWTNVANAQTPNSIPSSPVQIQTTTNTNIVSGIPGGITASSLNATLSLFEPFTNIWYDASHAQNGLLNSWNGTAWVPVALSQVVGGALSNSSLTLESTSGTGTTDSIIFKVGAQIQAGAIYSNGFWTIGPLTNTVIALDINPFANNASASAPYPNDIIRVVGGDGLGALNTIDTFGGTGAWQCRRVDGTAAARQPVIAAELPLCSFQALGWMGTSGYSGVAASVDLSAGENWSNSANGTIIRLRTTLNTTNGPQITNMTIFGDGGVFIGNNGQGTTPSNPALDPGAYVLAVTGSIRSPALYGGTAVNSTLILASTTAVGSGDKIVFQTGFQATVGQIGTSGTWAIGTQPAASGVFLDVNPNGNAASAPPAATNVVQRVVGADGAAAFIGSETFGGTGGFIIRRADGTAASKTGLVNGDNIGSFAWNGFTNASVYSGNAAAIRGVATDTWTATDTGALIQLRTTPNGSATNVANMILDGFGHIQVGSAAPTPTAPCVLTAGTTSTDASGEATATGATSCVITFAFAYTLTPRCSVTDVTTAAGLKASATTAALTVTGLTSSDTFTWSCQGT